jgi:hypothetical protein
MLFGTGTMLNARPIDVPSVQYLTELVYELLDAHQDTSRLAAECGPAARWDAHLDYLRDLQRVAREALARVET